MIIHHEGCIAVFLAAWNGIIHTGQGQGVCRLYATAMQHPKYFKMPNIDFCAGKKIGTKEYMMLRWKVRHHTKNAKYKSGIFSYVYTILHWKRLNLQFVLKIFTTSKSLFQQTTA